MPVLPILVHLPDPAPGLLTCPAAPVLLLTWHPADALPRAVSPPTAATRVLSPLPMPRVSLLPPSHAVRAPSRCDRRCWDEKHKRIAARDDGKFVSIADKVTQLKALKNSLSLCSKTVQLHVTKKKLLQKTKKPIVGEDLAKLSATIGLGADTARALDRAMAIGDATTRALDQVLGHRNV